MATGRINRQIIDYIDSMAKKTKQMKFVKDLKKEVETGKNGTQKYVVKQGINKGKIFSKDAIDKIINEDIENEKKMLEEINYQLK